LLIFFNSLLAFYLFGSLSCTLLNHFEGRSMTFFEVDFFFPSNIIYLASVVKNQKPQVVSTGINLVCNKFQSSGSKVSGLISESYIRSDVILFVSQSLYANTFVPWKTWFCEFIAAKKNDLYIGFFLKATN